MPIIKNHENYVEWIDLDFQSYLKDKSKNYVALIVTELDNCFASFISKLSQKNYEYKIFSNASDNPDNNDLYFAIATRSIIIEFMLPIGANQNLVEKYLREQGEGMCYLRFEKNHNYSDYLEEAKIFLFHSQPQHPLAYQASIAMSYLWDKDVPNNKKREEWVNRIGDWLLLIENNNK